jgi:putative oxidoreductase
MLIGFGLLLIRLVIGLSFIVHGPNGYWITKGGYEYCLAVLVVAIGVALTGAGQYSLDGIFNLIHF